MSAQKLTAILVGLAMLALSGCRLLPFLVYPEDFRDLSAAEVLTAFLAGLRFDPSILLLYSFLPILMIHLPAPIARRAAWTRAWAWVTFASVAALLLVMGGNLVYFGHVHRHLSSEPSLLQADLPFLLGLPLSYAFETVVLLAALFALGLAWQRIVNRKLASEEQHWCRRSLGFFAISLALFLGIRGTLRSRSLTDADAFTSESFASGTLLFRASRRSDSGLSSLTSRASALSLATTATRLCSSKRPIDAPTTWTPLPSS